MLARLASEFGDGTALGCSFDTLVEVYIHTYLDDFLPALVASASCS